jgi:hypothetical protein
LVTADGERLVSHAGSLLLADGGDGFGDLAALWSALARARETAWALGAAPTGPLVIDIDATLVDAHSEKQGAAPTFKGGFGFHPLAAGWTAGMAPGKP